jgi:anthranilate synthase component 2
MHGKSSPVFYDEELGKALFNGLPKYDLISEPFESAKFYFVCAVYCFYILLMHTLVFTVNNSHGH